MNRQSVLAAGLLAVAGCGSQSPSTDVGSTNQDLSVDNGDALVRAEPWSPRLVQSQDYWDFGVPAADGSPANAKMVALVINASDNTPDNVIGDATRMVWLVSNARVSTAPIRAQTGALNGETRSRSIAAASSSSKSVDAMVRFSRHQAEASLV